MPSCNSPGLDAVTPDRSALAEPQSAFQPCHHRCFIAQAAVKGVVIAGGMTGVAAFSVALMLNRACVTGAFCR